MNRVELIGRLTSKPELRYSGTNIPYTRFSIAVDRNFSSANGEKQTDFINISVWRKQAENVCNYLDKGSLVAIEGRIQTGNYTDKNGNKVYTTDIMADNVQFLESKKSSQTEPRTSGQAITSQEIEQNKVDNDPFADFGNSIEIDDNFLE